MVRRPLSSPATTFILPASCSLHQRLLERIEITLRGAPVLEFCCEKWIDENAPSVQLFPLKFENRFIRDSADCSLPHLPPSGPPSRPLPAPPAQAPSLLKPSQALHFPSSSLAPSPSSHGDARAHSPVPSTSAECLRVFQSDDVGALTDLFGRANIDLLAKTFTIAQEEHVVERLSIPVKKGHKQVERDFVTDIQNYIRSHPTSLSPPTSAPSLSAAAPVHPNQAPALLPCVPPHDSGHLHASGRKDKVRTRSILFWVKGF